MKSNTEKILIKIIANGLIVFPLLILFTGIDIIPACITAIILSIVAYVIGDLLILRATSNIIATLADFILAYIFLWVTAGILNWPITHFEITSISILLAVVEYIYHIYLGRISQPETS